tara:strand:+ start:80 stop:1084 length:1005 start_codon:yes stop_codon:yes gene_type:complete
MSSFIYSQCLGDLNEDYTINVQDVVIMISSILYDDEIDYDVADINDDGNVDILDIISVVNIILYENNSCISPIDIIYNIHESLPIDWVTEFYIIMNNLTTMIPANQNYFDDLIIYAWNSNVEDPYPGIQGGTYIGGSDDGFYMVLEINEMEFAWNHMHRYSVIAHEYFHVYQLSINQPMNEPNGGYNPNTFSIKWLIEGTATTFESMYVQNYYDYNYFLNDLIYTDLSDNIHTNPSIFEDYSSNNIDINYTSSVFMVLALAKELIDLGHSEENAFKMIFEEFMLTGAKNSNWENYFLDIFGFSVNDFYESLQLYTLDLEDVIPSSSLSIQQIFD